jgi:hypothetical protein
MERLQDLKFSMFTDKGECSCHFPAHSRNCRTPYQAPQGFSDASQISLHKDNKINLCQIQNRTNLRCQVAMVPRKFMMAPCIFNSNNSWFVYVFALWNSWQNMYNYV